MTPDAKVPAFHILTVCTMNICRSPSMAALISDRIDACQSRQVSFHVSSAGVAAQPGVPNCEIALAYVGRSELHSLSRQLTISDTQAADLILVAQQSHVKRVLDVDPAAGEKTVSLRGMARTIDVAVSQIETVDTIDGLRSLVGLLALLERRTPPPHSRLPYGTNDVPDPHVLGVNLHAESARLMTEAVTAVGSAIERHPGSPARSHRAETTTSNGHPRRS